MIYSASGILAAKLPIVKNRGSVRFDLSRAGAGVYIATINYGAFRKSMKVAVTK
jgi:hypothetical protein